MRLHPILRPGAFGIMVVAPAALLLAACGSSSPSSSPTSSSPPSSSSSTTSSSMKTTTSSMAAASTTSSSMAATNGSFDSCNAVTQAQAAAALGQSVTAGVLGSATVEGGLACVFYGPAAATPHTPDTPQMDSVRVVVVEGSNALTWYDNYKGTVPAQSVSDYGDQSYWDGGSSLSVMKGSDYLRICVWPADAAPSETDAETLGSGILPNL